MALFPFKVWNNQTCYDTRPAYMLANIGQKRLHLLVALEIFMALFPLL